MTFINHNSLLNIHYINALSSTSSLLMSIKTATAAGLDLSPNVPNYSPLCQDTSPHRGPCQWRCASLCSPPHSFSIAEISNKQTNLLIAFPKLKGAKICEVQIPKWTGSSLKSADRASGAAGLDHALWKGRAQHRAQPFKFVASIY